MGTGAITEYIDVAQLALYGFWIFFAALIFYIQRESRREGFPKINMAGEQIELPDIFKPTPKAYRMADGRMLTVPDPSRDDKRPIKAQPYEGGEGAALVPTGNPMVDGVGPAAWCERSDLPDVTYEGKPRIVPMRVARDFKVDARDFDMIGKQVLGADGKTGGTVRDIWVDRSEFVIRYVEVEVNATRRVLLPIAFANISRREGVIKVDAILAQHFAMVPTTKSPDLVTLLEEDKIAGFYGGGLLYATPDRQESLV